MSELARFLAMKPLVPSYRRKHWVSEIENGLLKVRVQIGIKIQYPGPPEDRRAFLCVMLILRFGLGTNKQLQRKEMKLLGSMMPRLFVKLFPGTS